jgi:hypothetical protein
MYESTFSCIVSSASLSARACVRGLVPYRKTDSKFEADERRGAHGGFGATGNGSQRAHLCQCVMVRLIARSVPLRRWWDHRSS